jgi:hypothetical protein
MVLLNVAPVRLAAGLSKPRTIGRHQMMISGAAWQRLYTSYAPPTKSASAFIMPTLTQALLGLKPQPYAGDLIRLGGDRDGAYLVPDDLAGISMCISPGASDTKLFEDELWHTYQIPSLLIDRSSSPDGFTTPMGSGQELIQKWLEPHDSAEAISLTSALAQARADAPDSDCLLQIDIEGAEYTNITKHPEDLLKAFRIIVIEFHNLGDLLRPWSHWHRRLKETIAALNKHHVCIHAHPNNCCSDFIVPGTEINLPQVLECTYLRRDRVGTSSASRNDQLQGRTTAVVLPHPLDITNFPNKPPLALNPVWTVGDAAFRQFLKDRGLRLRNYAKAFMRDATSRVRRR